MRVDTPTWTFCHILPRGMAYALAKPTSIDLFVSEISTHSRFRTIIMAETAGPKLPASELIDLPRFRFANTQRRASFVASALKRAQPDLVIVQQHLPSAGAINARIALPVILQKHNFIKQPNQSRFLGAMSRALHLRQMRALAGITFVSEAVKSDFERDWPEVEIPKCVVPNGIETKLWLPAIERQKVVLVVGRCVPEKGMLEAAQALAAVLPQYPDWRCTFVLSETDRNQAYCAAVEAQLATLGVQAQILRNQPFSVVQALNQSSAIALVASKWREPFGRTCLEAHAGGAALIASGTGGMREISGSHALFLDQIDGPTIAHALSALMSDASLRQGLARDGRERVLKHFDIRHVASALDNFGANVIEHHRA